MVAELNEAGLVITVDRQGTVTPLPASVDLSAYRIVQEALTNALKHGGVGTLATVTLVYDLDRFQLKIVDDGRGRFNGRTDASTGIPAVTAGHGLIGMRERVALHRGQFTAEREHGSGFVVKAEFPLVPSPTAS
jgi:signal transduction histidine kinase